MKYLFDEWQEVREKLKDRQIFVFLDFDGTLAPIAPSPQQAVLSKEARELLDALSKNPSFKTAIVSGRSLQDIKGKIGLKNIIYVGNHGAEIEGPKIKFSISVSQGNKEILERIKSDLARRLSSVKGVILEDKGLSLSLHYRKVDKKDIVKVKSILHEAIILYLVRNKVKLNTGKSVFEIRLPSEWDKGKVVLWLLARQKSTYGENGFVPLYIGDDKTDEDAFSVLRNNGLTIFVGTDASSHAQYYLKGNPEVIRFLKRLLKTKQNIRKWQN